MESLAPLSNMEWPFLGKATDGTVSDFSRYGPGACVLGLVGEGSKIYTFFVRAWPVPPTP
jgi:hypothetical protein